MKTIETEVHPGVCGMIARIYAESDDQQFVRLRLASECARIRDLASRLDEVDGYQEIADGFEGRIHSAVRESISGCCSGCTVPSGVYKSMQVAAGLALPVDATIRFSIPADE